MIIGSFGYIASLGCCAWAFYAEYFVVVPVCIFAFIAAHAIGQGAVIWVLISEIFPDKFRAQGQSLGSFYSLDFCCAADNHLSQDGNLVPCLLCFSLFLWNDDVATRLGLADGTRDQRSNFGTDSKGAWNRLMNSEYSNIRIVALGEVLWDLFPDGDRFGGAAANFACHAALLGARVSIVKFRWKR